MVLNVDAITEWLCHLWTKLSDFFTMCTVDLKFVYYEFEMLGFVVHGIIFLILCLLQRLFRSTFCLWLIVIYGLLLLILYWSSGGFWPALIALWLMGAAAGNICRWESEINTNSNSSNSQNSYSIVSRNFDTTNLNSMLERVEYERRWTDSTFNDSDFVRIYNIDSSYKRRILEMFDAVLKFGDRMVVCQSYDNAGNWAEMKFTNNRFHIEYTSLPWREYSDGSILQQSIIRDGSYELKVCITDADNEHKCWWEYDNGSIHYIIDCAGIHFK